jgi:BolA family transcriptional regulator, general stress-responsive regulator
MRVRDRLETKLKEHLVPTRLLIVDDSARHAGHAGAHPGGESHFNVTVVSNAFEGLTRVKRQQMVYAILAEELKGPVHALSLKTLTPQEDAAPSA